MKKLGIVTLATLLTLSTNNVKAQTTQLGPLSVDMSFCEQYDKWSSIISAYSNIIMPVGGAMGITTGTMMNTSVLVDFCQFMTSLQHLSLQGQVNMAVNLANKMSGEQFTKEIGLTRDLFDITSSVVDLEKGGMKKGAATSTSTHRRLAQFMKDGADYAGIEMKTKAEKQADMARLARLSYQRTVLKETVKCPAPPTNNESWNEIQEKEVIPLENNTEILEEYIKGYQQALLAMGRKVIDPREYEKYVKDLEDLVMRSSTLSSEFVTKSVETTTLEKVKAPNPEDPMAKRAEEKKGKLDQKYQKFTVRSNPNYKNEFVKKYAPIWNYYVKATAYTTTYGIANKAESRVENEFKDDSILCNRGKYAEQFDRQDPEYHTKVQRAIKQCKENSSQAISSSGGLFQFYAESLYQRDVMLKTNLARLWGLESEHLGYTRIISEGTPAEAGEIFSQPEAQCAPMNNIAKMAEIQLKQQALEAELTQETVEQLMKQNSLLEREEMRKEEEKREQDRRNRINEEIRRRKTWIGDDMPTTGVDQLKI